MNSSGQTLLNTKNKDTKPNIQYTVKRLDLDGNGTGDHNLVTMFVNGKVADAKVITTNAIINNTAARLHNPLNKNKKQNTNATQPMVAAQATKIVYRNMPQVQNSNKPIIIQEKSSLGHYFKTGLGVGAGASLGSMAVGGLVQGIGSFFGNDD